MAQTLPEGAMILPAELTRLNAALKSLADDNGATATVNIAVRLHLIQEYPKRLDLGDTAVLVGSPAEESAAKAEYAAKKAAKLPSAADLDVVAAEEKAKVDTSNKGWKLVDGKWVPDFHA